jgi:hypothetical protein
VGACMKGKGKVMNLLGKQNVDDGLRTLQLEFRNLSTCDILDVK